MLGLLKVSVSAMLATVRCSDKSCGVLGCLRFLFRPCLPRFAVVIFTAIFPLGYPGVDVTFR